MDFGIRLDSEDIEDQIDASEITSFPFQSS